MVETLLHTIPMCIRKKLTFAVQHKTNPVGHNNYRIREKESI